MRALVARGDRAAALQVYEEMRRLLRDLRRPRLPCTIHVDGIGRVDVVGEPERTEKITVNLGPVDLGRIDLLVQEGFFTNRTDFIRTAVRAQLARSESAIEHTVARRTLVLGTQHFSRADLERLRATGEQVHIRVLGLATVAEDVDPELALATIASVEVLGAFRASRAVKAALGPRIV